MSRQPLDTIGAKKCLENARYRLNCMMDYDLYVFIQKKNNNPNSVYATGQLLEPAFEISIVFGRQLLQFLKITKPKKKDELELFCGNDDDDVMIDQYYPSMTDFPINDPLALANKIHLVRLFTVANKATAHFTNKETKKEQFESLEKARKVIYELMMKYLPDLKNLDIRWRDRDNFSDAVQK